jgi:hypothetical protein
MEHLQPFQGIVNGKDHAIIPCARERQMEGQVDREKKKAGQVQKVDRGRFFLDELLSPRKNEEEMEQQRWKDEQSDFVQPVKKAVEKIHFSCRGKNVKRIKDKTKEIKINVRHGKSFFRVEKNNNADDQSGQPDKRQVKIGELRSFEGQEKGREEKFSFPADLILDFLARRCGGPMAFDDINLIGYRQVIDGIEDVSFFDPGQIGGAVWFDPDRYEPVGLFSPYDPIGRLFPDNFFIYIYPSERQDDGNENEG